MSRANRRVRRPVFRCGRREHQVLLHTRPEAAPVRTMGHASTPNINSIAYVQYTTVVTRARYKPLEFCSAWINMIALERLAAILQAELLRNAHIMTPTRREHDLVAQGL